MYSLFLSALTFASEKHMLQRRKGCDQIPYINHLIKVTDILYFVGEENDFELLTASILHDILEDTPATEEELREKFGNRVTDIVLEVTDNMQLSYEDRKRYQIKKALVISNDAKKIKIADKISNIRDMITLPVSWSNRRKQQYVDWAEQVVANCAGVNIRLDKAFIETAREAKKVIAANLKNQNEPME